VASQVDGPDADDVQGGRLCAETTALRSIARIVAGE
jgi:hypothetical protein